MRRPTFTAEVAEAAEDLVRQSPPAKNDRATWTLQGLATALQERFAHITSISHETVRRLLHWRGIPRRGYRHAKEWLTSPDPLYSVRKARRDRLLAMARAAPDGAAVWLDQSWFIRWPYRFWNWGSDDDLPRVAKRWSEKVQTTALYAALDDESQTTFLDWADGQPNSDRTITFLEALLAHWNEQDKRFIVLFWDHAPWHTSKQTCNWIRAYNRRAKQHGLTRLIVSYLPVRSPWLMPLEAIFGYLKHQVLGDRRFDTITALRAAVERYFTRRVAPAKERRDAALAAA